MKKFNYIVLAIFIVCLSMYAQAPVTTQEITALETQIQNLLEKKYGELKGRGLGAQQVEQQKLQEIDKTITYLQTTFQRLQEVDDMPLSRPEADQIKTQLNQFNN